MKKNTRFALASARRVSMMFFVVVLFLSCGAHPIKKTDDNKTITALDFRLINARF
jgi:hypothetical protein